MTAYLPPKKILICDDDADILCMLECLLSTAGYQVSSAASYEEFFEKYKREKPALVLLDVRMPEHDGFWIAEELHRLGNTAPVIFVTAHVRSIFNLSAPIPGAVDLIVKPFEPEFLLSRVSRALRTGAFPGSLSYATSALPRPVEQTTE